MRLSENKKRLSPAPLFLFLFALLAASVIAGLLLGATSVSMRDVLEGLRTGGNTSLRIFAYVRLPRVLAGCLSGCALAVSGAILQTVLNNSLAGPNVVGVNAGSGLAMLVFVALFPGLYRLFPAAAFLGGFVCALLIYAIARLTGASRTTIILAGVAVNSVVNAVSNIIKVLFPEAIVSYTNFSVGTLSNVTMQQLTVPAGIIALCLLIALFLGGDMNVLLLGEETARSLGMRVNAARLLLIALAAALAGAAVSFGGQIAFVGLLVPHIARLAVGMDNRLVVPLSALMGAIFVLLCDLGARTLFAPFEVPVGVILSFIGGIFFIYLLLSRKGGKLND